MEPVSLVSLCLLILSRFACGATPPPHSRLIVRLIALFARKMARNRAARMRRYAKHQQMCSKDFAAFLTDYCSRTPTRTTWIRQRSGVWWQHVLSSWTDCEWTAHFRMRRTAFLQLCNLLQPHLQRRATAFRKPVPVDQRVAICVWRLATNVEYRTISHLFGVGQSTAVSITNHVASAIVKNLLPLFIRTPSEQEFVNIIQGFRDGWGFPQCAGAIDCTHIGILAPPVSSADYYNRKGFYSVILQGVVDHRLMFWDINVGWPGKVHASEVFANSSLFERGQSNTLFLRLTERLEGVDVPVVVLGDAAYPLLPWLMKPYPDDQHTTPEQITFNNHLSRARRTVERAFGLLKGRWRCLVKRCDCRIENINTIICACCILHNFCQVNGEEFEEIATEENVHNECDEDSPARSNATRDALSAYFSKL